MPGNSKQEDVRKLLSDLVERKIELRAYELYESRGRADGLAEQDWLQAEGEVLRQSILAPLRRRKR
jgi:Protein of unknown function (DUF2934)